MLWLALLSWHSPPCTPSRLFSPQLEHTTLPKREHGHKQLGKAAAAAHILQLGLFFALGAAVLGVAAPQQPGQARVANATFGILYALQVRGTAQVGCSAAMGLRRQFKLGQ